MVASPIQLKEVNLRPASLEQEYLMNKDEEQLMLKQDPSDRPLNFLPRQYDALRKVRSHTPRPLPSLPLHCIHPLPAPALRPAATRLRSGSRREIEGF